MQSLEAPLEPPSVERSGSSPERLSPLRRSADTVVLQERIAVGRPLPRSVMLTPVPENPSYAFAVVNNQRVIVDPKTYTVVQVVQ